MTASADSAAVAATYCLSVDDLLRRRDAAGFRAAAYLLRRAANLPLRRVAGMFGISQPWVSRIQAQIERGAVDRRLRSLLRRFNLRTKPKPAYRQSRRVNSRTKV